jgi:3-phenylpropionate/trans-cinnamate dioxygenase ferredoxin reductase subunit
VDLRVRTEVASLVPDGSGTAVGAVELADGTLVEADLVVVGIGAAPRVDLAKAAGLRVENGVVVDQHLRSSHPHVLAVGDIARAAHPFLGTHVRVEHWANALNQPAAAAATIVGADEPYDALPYFFTDQYDLGMEYVGYVGSHGYDEVVVRGDLEAREFVAFWRREGRVLAGMNVNVWDVVDDVQTLIRSRAVVDRERLADPDVPLADLV